jgi:ABC-type antimicrobial peptide transport system permease subunit
MGGETAKAYERFGFEAIFPATVNSSIFIQQAIIVLILGLILSIYPVYRIVRLNPVKAMKEN